MSARIRDLPKSAWRRAVVSTVIVVGLSVIASDLISTLLLDALSQGINLMGLLAATLLPIVLGGPMMFYQALRHQQLKLANAQLDILASTDWLTDCLNRRAFTAGASALLDPAAGHTGTLLVIDADHFKLVNDRFGHEAGDEALQCLATAIAATVRSNDLVGRLGGEEFGVFVVDADYDAALAVAERIRDAVGALRFAPGGVFHPLSVSIGGASLIDHSRFADLFRAADQQLYGAKAAGRNRIAMVRMPASMDAPANSNRPPAIDKTALAPL
jgi:diguanylate cyclase (GGDEF)-like protein